MRLTGSEHLKTFSSHFRPPTWFATTMVVVISAMAIGVSIWDDGRFIGPTIYFLVYLAIYSFMQRQSLVKLYEVFPVSESNHLEIYSKLKIMIGVVWAVLFIGYSMGDDSFEAFFDDGNVYGVIAAWAVLLISMTIICGYCKNRFMNRLKAEGYAVTSDE